MAARKKKAKRCTMVTVSLDALELNKNTGTFRFPVELDGEKLGELTVGRGSVSWFARNAKKPTRKLNWRRFAALMEER